MELWIQDHTKGPSINDVDNWDGGRGQKLVKIANHPFILRPQFLQLLEIWFEKSGSRKVVREIWFEKSG